MREQAEFVQTLGFLSYKDAETQLGRLVRALVTRPGMFPQKEQDVASFVLAELAALREENARLRGIVADSRKIEDSVNRSLIERAANENARLREALTEIKLHEEILCRNSVKLGPMVRMTHSIAAEALSVPAPSTHRLVPVERLREVKGTIEQLQAVQNGCPLPDYEEAFRLANIEADKCRAWLSEATRDAHGT